MQGQRLYVPKAFSYRQGSAFRLRWRQTFGKGRWQVSNAKTYHTSLVTKLVFVRVHGYSRPSLLSSGK